MLFTHKLNTMRSRRDFLQKFTATALAWPMIQLNTADSLEKIISQPYQGKMLNVAIMGLGSYGSRVAASHARLSESKADRLDQWHSG